MKTNSNTHSSKNHFKTSFFGLTHNSIKERRLWRLILFALAAILPGILIFTVTIFQTKVIDNYTLFAFASVIKYLPLIWAAYILARRRAANYLDDIFELRNETLAINFIENIAFGGGAARITIADGKIIKEGERSSLVLIGGPGQILVHLGNVAVVESAQGTPKIISTNNKPWEIEGFERIREIGQYDEVGKREYAIVNLRDQFVRELNLSARTKDSIHIEIKGIKVIFSILRDQKYKGLSQERNPFTYDNEAILSLIYDQAVITRPLEIDTSIKFPWDTTVIPLIISDLEKLIQSHTLSELLASTGQKEMDEVASKERELEKIRLEILGEVNKAQEDTAKSPPTFFPRSVITEKFFSTEFRQKAAKLGVTIEWIDIGTWEISYKSILEKLKEARELTIKNAKYEKDIEKKEKELAFNQILEFINKVIISIHDQSGATSKLNTDELKKLAETIRNNPELSNLFLARQLYQQMIADKVSQIKATEIIKAFHTELLAAKEIINNEVKSPVEREEALKKINNALQSIEKHIYHVIGRK